LALWLVGFSVVVGLVSRAYPAFYLSSWAPLTALTGKQPAAKGNLRLREALVLLQFTFSVAFIARTLLMAAQNVLYRQSVSRLRKGTPPHRDDAWRVDLRTVADHSHGDLVAYF
jgi:hypothetical protein